MHRVLLRIVKYSAFIAQNGIFMVPDFLCQKNEKDNSRLAEVGDKAVPDTMENLNLTLDENTQFSQVLDSQGYATFGFVIGMILNSCLLQIDFFQNNLLYLYNKLPVFVK